MGTLYLRMPPDDELFDEDSSSASAILDTDPATAWTASAPMTPGQAIIIDRGQYSGSGRYENMIDDDPATKWSTAFNMTPGQAIIIDRGDAVPGIGDPANMIDGDLSTTWTSGADMRPGMAVIIDRGEGFLSKLFNQVVMESSGQHPEDYARTFTISVSDDKKTWAQIYSGHGASAAITTNKFPSRLERYVKITQTSTAAHWWTLASVRLMYNTGPTHDLATSNWQISIGGIDSNLPIANLLIMKSVIGAHGYAREFDVKVSTNRTSWTTVASGVGTEDFVSLRFPDTRARYIKIEVTKAAPNLWTLTDIDLRNDQGALNRSEWTIDVEGNVGDLPKFNQLSMDSGTNLNGYARAYIIYVSADAITWTQAYAGAGTAPAITTSKFFDQSARFIKIVQNSTTPYYWSLATVSLLMDGTPLVREAWDIVNPTTTLEHPEEYWRPISVDGAGPTISNPANAIDGDALTRWTTQGATPTGQALVIDRGSGGGVFDTVLIDFGAPLSGQTGWDDVNGKVGTRIQISVSNDGLNWIWMATAYAYTQFFSAKPVTPQATRYIQIALMDPLNQPWTIANINLFSGDAPLSRVGWTASTANISNFGLTHGLLWLNTTQSGWIRHLPPDVENARPLKLKLANKTWRTVLHLGQTDGLVSPLTQTYSRLTTRDEVTNTHNEFITNYRFPDYDIPVQYGAQSYMLQADSQTSDEWARERIDGRPVGNQILTHRVRTTFSSTIWFSLLDLVKRYWDGNRVTKLRFGFQIQQYSWATDKVLPGTPRGTVTLFRHTPPPTFGQPALPGTGTPIHTFSPVIGNGLPDIRANYRNRGDVPLQRGDTFWYEIDPVWQDIAFSLRTSWDIANTPIPVIVPGESGPEIPALADGSYQYFAEDYTIVRVLFQVVTG